VEAGEMVAGGRGAAGSGTGGLVDDAAAVAEKVEAWDSKGLRDF
jgi:hypothetical protein